MNVKSIARAGVIAALYAILTILLAPISYGPIQCRLSEALCILPAFTSSAVPGLFIGCLAANLLTGAPVYDVVFGSLATLLAAVLTRILAVRKFNKAFLPLPAVVINGIIIGIVLKYAYRTPISLPLIILYVAIGEAAACYCAGFVVYCICKKYESGLFR